MALFFSLFPPGWRPGFLTRPSFDRTCICLGALYPVVVVVPVQRPSCNERAKSRRVRRCATCIVPPDPSDLAVAAREFGDLDRFFSLRLSVLPSRSAALNRVSKSASFSSVVSKFRSKRSVVRPAPVFDRERSRRFINFSDLLKFLSSFNPPTEKVLRIAGANCAVVARK